MIFLKLEIGLSSLKWTLEVEKFEWKKFNQGQEIQIDHFRLFNPILSETIQKNCKDFF